MVERRCPGRDLRSWKPEDIYDLRCPNCSNEIEFWRDEPMRVCSKCGKSVRNPKVDLRCAQWCKAAEECVEGLLGADMPDSSSEK